mgnify:CR=1 FL=1
MTKKTEGMTLTECEQEKASLETGFRLARVYQCGISTKERVRYNEWLLKNPHWKNTQKT